MMPRSSVERARTGEHTIVMNRVSVAELVSALLASPLATSSAAAAERPDSVEYVSLPGLTMQLPAKAETGWQTHAAATAMPARNPLLT